MSPIKKTALRRTQVRNRAGALLKSLCEGRIDTYEGYRQLYGFWCSYNAAVPELRPLFRIPGVEPDGPLSVTENFRERVRVLAIQILPLISGSGPKDIAHP